ncbi:uncharacterized protein A4U43_C07F4900 [Asparagus officinalis]|uniref:DUF3741 domain-containing protein n=1 Tax=Asparagus officinalis TaxID=4686 RepID=A0A5P1EBE3_ASPOF|nr:uncharacterized protein LOC109849183 [Asparagus officinalis]ONK62517.1 uncharacterized protein A4U43_C07F4900 [Asparagus officinalis]
MKISSSSSPFDLSSNEATSGCLSGLLRRLRCKNFRHSSLYVESFDADVKEEQKKPPQSPCLVARLMGLDTMPVHPYTPTESISRSRSTNSVDGFNGFLSGKRNWMTNHRTSQSFREEPTFLRKENEDFLVLSFVPDEKSKIDCGELKDMKSVKVVEKKGRKGIEGKESVMEKRQSQCEVSKSKTVQKKDLCRKNQLGANNERFHKAIKQREEPRRSNSKKKRADSAAKKLETECSSEDSSPVSVLDRNADIDSEYVIDPNFPISEEENKPKEEKPRRKLSSELNKAELIRNSNKEGLKIDNVEIKRRKSSEKKEGGSSDIWAQACQLAADDVKKSSWDFREIWRSENNGEIAAEIGIEIIDIILNEVLTELSICSITI